MSREKILKAIKKNISYRVEKNVNYSFTKFDNKLEEFIKNFKAAGGEIVNSTNGFEVTLNAQFGVAENGSCFINSVKDRKLYTYYSSIVILLDKSKIVNSMEEAMKLVEINDFALFMCGPSKTADIEQSLVIGAHGAKRVGLMFG